MTEFYSFKTKFNAIISEKYGPCTPHPLPTNEVCMSGRVPHKIHILKWSG